ncbi:MAG: branched-chain amino acid ABC transporter substrate-binding protein [Candidatus Velthaea sp.]
MFRRLQLLRVTGLAASIALVLSASIAPRPVLAQSSGPPTVKIAVIAPLSGAFSVSGQDILSGAKLAAEQINAAGGIKSMGGAKIELLVGDAGDSPDKTTAITRQILSQKPAGAIGAWYSSLSLAGTQVAEQLKIPWVTGSYSDALVDRGFQYTFQNVAGIKAGDQALEIVLNLLKARGKKSRVAVAKDTNVASAEQYKGVQRFDAEGLITLVGTETWTPPLSDATPIATSILAGKPDIIIVGATSTTDSALLQRQLHAQGSHALIVGLAASQGNSTYLSSVGAPALEGMMIPIQAFPGKGSAKANEAFVKVAHVPFMGAEGLTGYTDTWTVIKAIETAKSADPEEVQKALRSMHLVNDPVMSLLPGGKDVRYGPNGRRIGSGVMVIQWQKGTPKVIYPEALANAKPIKP